MTAINLTKAASYLYHNDPTNPIRWLLYGITKGTHPKDEIKAVLSKEVLKVVQIANPIEKKVKKRRK